jgi:hypothetical protein
MRNWTHWSVTVGLKAKYSLRWRLHLAYSVFYVPLTVTILLKVWLSVTIHVTFYSRMCHNPPPQTFVFYFSDHPHFVRLSPHVSFVLHTLDCRRKRSELRRKSIWFKIRVITNDVSGYVNLLVRIAHIICNHPLFQGHCSPALCCLWSITRTDQ